MKFDPGAESRLRASWTWLTRPSSLVKHAEDRKQSKRLAALHIFAILLGLPVAILLGQPLIIPVILVLYLLNRAGYVDLAVHLTVYGTIAAIFIAATMSSTANLLMWLLVPLLLSVLLFANREVMIVSGLILVGTLAYPTLQSGTSLQSLLESPLSVLAVSAVLTALLAQNRFRGGNGPDAAAAPRKGGPDFEPVLSERERMFLLLAENSPDYVYVWEPNKDRVPYFNKDGFLGYTREELATPGFLSSIAHEDDWDALQAHWQTVLKLQPVAPIEYRVRHKQGHWEWLERHSTVLGHDDDHDEQGLQVLVVLRPITERKTAEIELRQQEARNRALLDAIPDMIIRMDRDGYYLQAWPFKKTRDHPPSIDPEELAGKHILDVLERNVAETILNKIQQVLDLDEVQYLEYQLMGTTGRRSYEARWVSYGDNEVLAIIRDITQRLEDQRRIEREASIYQNVVEAIIVTEKVDDDYYVVSLNKAAQTIYGWSLEEARGKHFTEVVRPIFPEDFPRERVLQQLEAGGHWSDEIVHHRRDGTPIHVFNSASILRDPDGKASGIVTIALDITHLKETEAALKIAEDRLYAALKRSPIVVSNQDRELRYTWIQNPATDFNPAAVIGKRDRDILENAEDALQLEALKTQVLESGVGLHREIPLHDRGEERRYQLTIEPLDNADGEIIGITCVQVDITETVQSEMARRKIQSLLQTMISNVPIIVWALDKNGVITLSEGMGLQRIGQEANQVTGQSVFDVYQNEPKFLASIRRALDGEAFTAFHESAQGVQYQTHFHPIYDQQGLNDGLVAVTVDLSERTNLEQNRLDLALERERINMLQHFMGDVSHDFKTPLTSIKLSLHLLQKATTEEDRQRHQAVIEMQTSRLENFMNDLFNMSRFDKAETNEFNFGRVDFNVMVSEVVAGHQPLIDVKEHTLHQDLDQSLGMVLGDRFQLGRVVTNLLVNAIHYTPAGGDLVIRTTRQEKWAIIEVQDNGRGIAPEDHVRIFQRFYRGDPARNSDHGGMGVGLAIAQKIVEAHGGQITVESALGAGSTFRVMIPEMNIAI